MKFSEGVAGWQGVCYAAGMEFPREIVKRCVKIPGGGEAPALPVRYRLDHCGMTHNDQSRTTRVWWRAELGDYPVESYEARAAWQALATYGARVVQLESEIDHTHVVVCVTVAW